MHTHTHTDSLARLPWPPVRGNRERERERTSLRNSLRSALFVLLTRRLSLLKRLIAICLFGGWLCQSVWERCFGRGERCFGEDEQDECETEMSVRGRWMWDEDDPNLRRARMVRVGWRKRRRAPDNWTLVCRTVGQCGNRRWSVKTLHWRKREGYQNWRNR